MRNNASCWRKSARSYGTGNCVEVQYAGQMADGRYNVVIVEDSARPYDTRMIVNRDAWKQFIAGVKSSPAANAQ